MKYKMQYKLLNICFIVFLLLISSVFSIRFNECGFGEGRYGIGEDCPGASAASSSSGGGTPAASPEVISELPVLPSELPLAQEIISATVTKVTEDHVEMEIVRRTDEGEIEKADISINLESEEITPGVFIEVPSLDLDLDIKDIKIPPTIDTTLDPDYAYIGMMSLFLAELVLIFSITKDISPKINKFYKKRRGQLFIVAAAIFILAIYSVAIKYNTVQTYTGLEDFKYLSDNYKTEFPKVANFAIYTGKLDPADAVTEFSGAFVQQARTKDPNFGVFYLFKDSTGDLHIVNMLNKKILRIKLTNIKSEELKIDLTDSNFQSKGEVCIDGIGIGCSTASTAAGNYGSGYDNTETLKGVKTICFEVPQTIPQTCLSSQDFDKFNSMILIQSDIEVLEKISGNKKIAVDLIKS